MLYKAKAAAEMDKDQWIRDDGSIEMAAIASYLGGDFNFNSIAWYWTLEPETAEQYRAFAARRCSWSDTWIIRIQIPKVFIDRLRKKQLWYSHDWKEFVWYCRKMMTPPSRYDSFWKAGEADIIEGHICSSLSTQVTRLKREEVQTNLTEANVMRIGSTKATQWAFVQRESADRLGQEMRGKIHIDITAAVEGQEK